MHIFCKRDALLKNVSIVQKAVSIRGSLPILSNILLEAKNAMLRVVATDLEIGIEASFEATVQEEGTITFPSKYLLEIIRRLPTGEVELFVEKGSQVNIKADKAHFTMSGLPADDFPLLPEIKEGQKLKIQRSILKTLIEETSFSCSKDEITRPELAGILLILSPGKIQAVATDGSRLALREVEATTAVEGRLEVLIPGRSLEELLRILEMDEENEVEVTLGNNQVEFRLPHRKLITRKIQSRFVNWEVVIPTQFEQTYLVDTKRFQESLDRCMLLARLVNNRILITSQGASVLLQAVVPEVGEVREELEWSQGSGSLSESFNVRYLLEGLHNIKTEYSYLAFAGKERPLVLRPSDEKGYLYLVMPLRS
ncbi:MAG: DNA polymerase III subunit beta [Coprothermobacterota bacterium]|nr:DNA polymerase III subunit beta [Coprothermobacterota bacterium]